MSDRIKLRIYDKFERKYWDENTIRQNAEWLLFGEENKENIEIERSTGLKDKNGKLIYEGDIVEVSEAYENGIYKIEFCQIDCEYNLYNKEGNFIYQLTKSMAKYMKVIGNIHENKELLDE